MEALDLFLSSYLVYFITWVVGCLFSIPLIGGGKLPPLVSFFARLVVGYLIIPLIYSLYYTGGYTIFTGVLLLYLVIIWLKRKEVETPNLTSFLGDWKYLLAGGVPLLLYLLLQFIRNDYFNPEITSISIKDNGVYASVAEYLKIAGLEVSSPWYQLFDVSNDGMAKVYHYEDLWYAAFVLDIFDKVPLYGYTYVFTTLATLLIFFAYLAFCASLREKFTLNSWIVMIAFSCVLFNMAIPGIKWTSYLDGNAFFYPKLTALPLCLCLGFVARRFQLLYVDCFAFGFLVLVDALFMPTILGAVGLLYAREFFIGRNKKEAVVQLVLLVICAGFFFIFYLVPGSMIHSSESTVSPGSKPYLFYLVKITAAMTTYQFTFLLPIYLSLAFLIFKKQLSRLHLKFFLLLWAVILFSSLSAGILNRNVESFQFASLVHGIISAFMLIGCWIMLVAFQGEKQWEVRTRNFLAALLILPIIYSLFSTMVLYPDWQYRGVKRSFLSQIELKITHINKLGAAISDSKKLTTFTIDPRVCYYCNFLKQAGKGFWVNRIDLPEILEEVPFKERSKAVELSPFYQFVQKLKVEGHYSDYEDAQMKFIEKNDVDFVVIEKGAPIPKRIKLCAESSITDSYSGTTVLFLYETCLN